MTVQHDTKSVPSSSPDMPTEDRIRAIAYAIWEEEGRPEGRDLDHWRRACELVESEAADPGWLQRKAAEAASAATARKPPLEEVVKRMKGEQAA